MKKKAYFISLLILISVFFMANSLAQDYARMGLPEGVVARLGKGYINDIAYAPDGTQLAVATSIGIWLYDTSTDTELNLLSEVPDYVQAIAFSPDGRTLASSGYSANYVIRLWDTDTGKLRNTIDGYEEILDLTFSPDGTMLAGNGGWPDFPIRLWSVATRQLHRTLLGFTRSTSALLFSEDGKTLISGSIDNSIRLWDVHTGELERLLDGHRDDVNSVVLSPDGKMLASGGDDGTVRFWNVRTGAMLAVFEEDSKFPEGINAVAFSPDGTTLASTTADQIWLWDISMRQVIRILEGHTTDITTIAFSPDGRTIASAGWDWTLRLWDASTGKLRRTFGEHTSPANTVAFSPDGKTIASASRGLIHLWSPKGALLRLWYARTGEHLENFIDHIDYVSTVVFSPDGKLIASSGFDSRLRLWDANTGYHIATLRGGGPAVAFSPDGELIANQYRGSRNNVTIGLWDVYTGELRHILSKHHSPLTCMAFSPDGNTLATGSRDSEIILWDFPTTQRRQSLTTQHTGPVYSVAFSPDGKTLASGSDDGTLRLWDPHTGEHKATLRYPDYITSVAYSPDGRILAIGLGSWVNSQIQLLDTGTLQPRETLVGHAEEITALTFSPDGRTLASASYDGTILLWETQSEVSVGQIPEDVNGDGSVNIDDLTFVAARLGHVEKGNIADVNHDGIVNILDLVAVSKVIEHTSNDKSTR